jgi:hypothetical protein
MTRQYKNDARCKLICAICHGAVVPIYIKPKIDGLTQAWRLAGSQQHYCSILIEYYAKQHCYKLLQDNCVKARLLRVGETLLQIVF